jgi:hypothetical protein
MIASETSRYRIDEMVRRSEAGRQASEAARIRRGPRVQGVRRLGATIAAIAMWPLRH